MKERWNLCIERIGEIQSETSLQTKWGSYFREVASFVLNVANACPSLLASSASYVDL